MARPMPVLSMPRGPLPAECRVPPHAPAIARTVPLVCPWRFSGIPQHSGLRGCKPYNGLQDMAAISAEGDTTLHPPRWHGGRSARPDVHDDTRGRASKRWAGAGRGSGSPVLAVLVLGERLEPPLDLSDPALELLDLTTRRPELLHDRLGQTLELPLERGQQAHPPGVQVLRRPLRPILDIHTAASRRPPAREPGQPPACRCVRPAGARRA